MKNLKELEKLNDELSKINVESLDSIEQKTSEIEKVFFNCVMEASQDEVRPDSDDGKKLVNLSSIFRNLGHRVLNLLKIELTISFAGVTLIHLQIPKLQNNQVSNSKNN